MSILSPKNALSVVRGATKTWTLTVKDPDGDPFDLTGATVYFSVKETTEDARPAVFKSSADSNQISIQSLKGGVAKILLVPADTKRLPLRPHVFDVWVVTAAGERHPVIIPSVLEIQPSVTVLG